MARLARVVVPGFPHHVTQRGSRRQPTFFESSDYWAYLNILKSLQHHTEVDILAYCLMPNHVHFVVVPHGPQSLARFFGPAHHRYARQVNAAHEWRGHLWQERFHSFVMDEPYFLAAVRYVENNPVRAGLCGRATQWKWSSARGHTGIYKDTMLTKCPLLDEIHHWSAFLDGDCDPDQLDDLREHTRSGRPAGGDEFVRRLESLTGRRLRRRKPGPRPRLSAADMMGPEEREDDRVN